MSKKIKVLTPRKYEHSDFFHNAVDFAREHSLNTNELCLELSHYLVDNFDKVWKIEKPRVYKQIADLEAKLAEKEQKLKEYELVIRLDVPLIKQLEEQLAEKEKQCQQCKHLNKKIELNIKNKLTNELAEKEKENLTLFSMLYETLEKQGCENITSIIEQMTNLTLEKQSNWFKENCVKDQDKTNFAIEKLEKVKEFIYKNSKLMVAESLDDSDLGSNYSAFFVFSNDIIDELSKQIKKLKEGK